MQTTLADDSGSALWTAFLRSLKARGLARVQQVISDAHTGLEARHPLNPARRRLTALPGLLSAQ